MPFKRMRKNVNVMQSEMQKVLVYRARSRAHTFIMLLLLRPFITFAILLFIIIPLLVRVYAARAAFLLLWLHA